MTAWDPERYLTYSDERGRPFVELLRRVDADHPKTVVDLGCGPGNLTALAAERWPTARVVGLDSSSAMVDKARASVSGIDFAVADLRDWAESAAPGSVDVLLSNATLQWVPGHLELLPALARAVRPGGWFAFQVPKNFDEPSHTVRAEFAAEEPYAAHTRHLEAPASHEPAAYLDALVREGFAVDAWETTYLHVLTGEDAVFTWISGTSLRPTAAALEKAGLFEPFADELKKRLARSYPLREDPVGNSFVLLPFRRVFVAARKLEA
ncbi:trans-aconitate 2-methyltransferase [Nocardioides luteus]|uniref:Trans-aconitate 2-methyltransferase n=1 Tax=Nocardioides luteus TaxID=1844 RepID=A0ABQ5T2Z4_9ACTN|nr:methyltransferase domain-containing protein [Nocardioides luteus]MDR7313662.1 trans-aconitate 2-methyltransferase [Nocardioides luteus]GGR64186.1 trans-aconitate 2-methyltransferase [Nocardioides luteus]GLJ70491.1 trans-aconitate 2-methyltransferase [Nocardioides luteus]